LAIKVSADKAANRSFLIDRHGEVVARYDKIHMFDVDLASGESYRESRNYRAGELAVLADLPWGRLGLTICYDLRFPALYRALAFPRCSTAAGSRAWSRWRSLRTSMSWEGRRDPLCAELRPRPRLRELVQKRERLRQAGGARPDRLPGLRLDQGRQGDHGARRGEECAARSGGTPTAGTRPGPGATGARRDAVGEGTRAARQAQGAARPRRQERRLRRPEISRGSAKDALRRGRASLDLRRGIERRCRRAHRGRHRAPPAADPARRAQLILRNHCAQISSTTPPTRKCSTRFPAKCRDVYERPKGVGVRAPGP